MTLMVRDEADVIGPMLSHHLDQGIDKIIVTDNGSIDGTLEILRGFSDRGLIDLREDPVHRKQQHSVVTTMARDAFLLYEADWVLNADADEFWMPVDRALTLRQALELHPKSLRSFVVPVVDMIGPPAASGSGLQRLIYRDLRTNDSLNKIGLHSHSTPDTVHIGVPDIEIAQGNHFVSLEGRGVEPPNALIEVLHFPWRSWDQFERKVRSAGLGYESNPDLNPSPNHHGMQEYRRYKLGSLQSFYILRHPTAEEFAVGLGDGTFVAEETVARTQESPVPDVALDPDLLAAARLLGPVIAATETECKRMLTVEQEETRSFATSYHETAVHARTLEEKQTALEETLRALKGQYRAHVARLEAELAAYRQRRAVRWIDGIRARRRSTR
ncbi:glycosyltransferase family 2 protein [Cryobacterium cheniae]|uniref:Glycosyltransferase family 2 protein n=1 Tax=Cryobacterium cheniae TaxID=1259262 RepID=A0A4V3IHH8_9MICO|nr:glycosyltransferase family 2 protein [Cryobacterium cheniae]TFC76669.1 glycosyltransferase family 2 protein [Cryobacterium cheniae]